MIRPSRLVPTVAVMVVASLLALASTYLAVSSFVVQFKIIIAACMAVITFGSVALWWRQDNVLVYRQAGIFATTICVPLIWATPVAAFGSHILGVYARVMVVGALAFVAGMLLGARIGNLRPAPIPITFARSLASGSAWRTISRRARLLGIGAVAVLLVSFVLMHYVPVLASDRLSAKYGVGAYAAGFARGRVPYHFGLGLASAIFPVLILMAWRNRTVVDIVLCGAVAAGLVASLNRGDFASGPLLVGVAIAIERRIRPVLIVAAVGFVFIAGSLSNEILLPSSSSAQPSLSARIAAGGDDVRDHLLFLTGFEREGSHQTHGRTIINKLLPGGSPDDDPTAYGLRLTTGVATPGVLASGGIRLPAPVWGYVSFGLPGAAAFTLLSGIFIGWGTVRIRRLLDPVRGQPEYASNLVVAAVVYDGIFVVFASFFFFAFADVLAMVVALMLGVLPLALSRGDDEGSAAAGGRHTVDTVLKPVGA